MPVENAIIAQARPYVLAQKAREILHCEAVKGCSPYIVGEPVDLEPVYQPVSNMQDILNVARVVPWVPQEPPPVAELARLQVWQSPEQSCDWSRSELLLKQLSTVRRRLVMEVVGNKDRVAVHLLCHRDDAPVVRAAFAGQFERCILCDVPRGTFLESIPVAAWAGAAFCDFYPTGPYSHLFTSPEEIKRSPFATLITCLANIESPAMGFYQVVFQPVSPDHDWHSNVKFLLDVEYRIKQMADASGGARYPQQPPSAALNPMSGQVETKAHNDKPFYAVALRIGMIDGGEQTEGMLRSLTVVAGAIQHGGRPLSVLTANDYRAHLSAEQVGRIFTMGLTHRPGFLLNSLELTTLVHVPPPDITEHLQLAFPKLETLPPAEALAVGTPIGSCDYANATLPVCIPSDIRRKHTHIIGLTGYGKSTTIEHMVLHDIRQGHGIAVLDPHGQLMGRLLLLIPEEYADKIIYINPGDPDWVPIWNPLRQCTAVGPDRIADDLVSAFKSFVDGWGDRLEFFLRHALLATLHLPGGNLRDVMDILRQKSVQSIQLTSRVLEVVNNDVARVFWQQEFPKYNQSETRPPHHKLSKLLTAGTYSYMLSQSDSSFDFRDIMDSGKILLVNLSSMGSEVRSVLGCFMLSLLHLTSLGRENAMDDSLLPFHIYCDEAHRFLTDAMEDMIAETRKFKVSLTLAHTCMSQFSIRKGNMIAGVGSTIIYRVNSPDAQHLMWGLQGAVREEDLTNLEVGQAIVRVGSHVARCKALSPLEVQTDTAGRKDRIIQQSRERYYLPIQEVLRRIRRRNERWAEPILGRYQGLDSNQDSPTTAGGGPIGIPEQGYDTF